MRFVISGVGEKIAKQLVSDFSGEKYYNNGLYDVVIRDAFIVAEDPHVKIENNNAMFMLYTNEFVEIRIV